MLFKTSKEVELNIKLRIKEYVKDNLGVSLKHLSSLLSVYLLQLKSIREIDSFKISDDINDGDGSFGLMFIRGGEKIELCISVMFEIINKIKYNKVVSYEIV